MNEKDCMEKIQNQKHTKETLYYSISRVLQGASYYGLRVILILYMMGEVLKMDRTETLEIYGLVSSSLIFSKIVGALLGDLLIGNKKSIIIGGIIQAIGAFSLCIPSTIGLYLGLFLVVLGCGLYTPNIIANFGKIYLNKAKLLDSAFTIFYLAINVGSFLGIVIIGYLGDAYGFNIGFMLSGVLMLISTITVFFAEEKSMNKLEYDEFPIRVKVINILMAFVIVSFFWGFYELANIRTIEIQGQLSQISNLNIPNHLWQTHNSIFILPIGIIAVVLWSYLYSNQYFKLMLGFVFGVISFGILFLVPEVPTEQHTIIYLISLLFLAISEICIAPIIHSILTKYFNPKYLAILISLAFLPAHLISIIFRLFNDKLFGNPMLGLKIGIIGMAIIGIGLIGYLLVNKKRS